MREGSDCIRCRKPVLRTLIFCAQVPRLSQFLGVPGIPYTSSRAIALAPILQGLACVSVEIGASTAIHLCVLCTAGSGPGSKGTGKVRSAEELNSPSTLPRTRWREWIAQICHRECTHHIKHRSCSFAGLVSSHPLA